MSEVTELFVPPDEIQAVLSRPFEEWSEQDYEHLFAWLHDWPRRSYLLEWASKAWIASGVKPTESTAAVVDEFYSRRVHRLLRRAQFKNIGALLLVEFDKFVWTSFPKANNKSSGESVGTIAEPDIKPLPDTLARSEIEPPQSEVTPPDVSVQGQTRPRKRLTKLERLLVAWPSSQPPSMAPEKEAGDWVETSVFGPRKVAQGRHFLLQAFAHKPDQVAEAQRLALDFDDEAVATLGIRTLGATLLPGTRLTFSVALPGLSVVEPIQEMVWQGRTEGVAFGVEVLPDQAVGNLIGTVTVAVDSIPIGRVTFKLEIKAVGKAQSARMDALDTIATDARRYELAFISYASPDRNKVLARVQMLHIQGIKFFQDLLNLEPGDRWAKELFRHIDECDLFLLFWSSHAKASEWVMKEVGYAIERKAGNDNAPPDIHPVIIEGPPPVEPPPELAHLHFNDKLIYFMERTTEPG